MVRSMTAHGLATVSLSSGTFSIDVQSVNKKGLDIKCSFSRRNAFLEIPFRKEITKQVTRGSVTVRAYQEVDHKDAKAHVPDVALLKGLKDEWETLAEGTGFSASDITFDFLVAAAKDLPTNHSVSEEELKEALLPALREALAHFVAMREAEGKVLKEVLERYLDDMESALQEIRELAPMIPKLYRRKITERLSDVSQVNEERLEYEVALLGDKMSIEEEIERLTSHIKQFRETLGSQAACGRRLEFLSQELFREVNTICSKSQDVRLTTLALGMKGTIDNIKEQVLNIE